MFLIGGRTKDVEPVPVLLRSGDIAIMSGESRHSYHGVPKILKCEDKAWQDASNSCMYTLNNTEDIQVVKKMKMSNSEECYEYACEFCTLLLSNYKILSKRNNTLKFSWTDFFEDYVCKSRINLNVRQVLFSGQTELSK